MPFDIRIPVDSSKRVELEIDGFLVNTDHKHSWLPMTTTTPHHTQSSPWFQASKAQVLDMGQDKLITQVPLMRMRPMPLRND